MKNIATLALLLTLSPVNLPAPASATTLQKSPGAAEGGSSETELDDIREAVFRHLFENNASGQ